MSYTRVIAVVAFVSFFVTANDEPSYSTDYFRRGDEFSVLVSCLYLGQNVLNVEDAEALFNKTIILLEMSPEMRSSLTDDARLWWEYFPTTFNIDEQKLTNVYWEQNCQLPTAKMREFFKTQKLK
jgi:hypothetical protein